MSDEKKTSIAEAEEISRELAKAAAELKQQAEDLRRDQEDAAARLRQRMDAAAETAASADEAPTEVRDLIPENADEAPGENTIKFRTKKVPKAKQAASKPAEKPAKAAAPAGDAEKAEIGAPAEEPKQEAAVQAAEGVPAADEPPAEAPAPEKKTRKQLREEKRAAKQAEKAAKKAAAKHPETEAPAEGPVPASPSGVSEEGHADGAKQPAESEPAEKPDPADAEKKPSPEDNPELIRLVKLEEAKIAARNKTGHRKRGVGFISSILFVVAMLCAVYGGIVVFILGTGAWFNFIWLIGAGVLLILSFILSHHSRLPKVLKALLVLIILACCANFGVFLYRDIAFAAEGPAEGARWLVVLGAKVNGTTPSVEFQARIDKAAEYVRDADFARLRAKTAALPPLVKVITTGGKGSDEGAAEGDVAARVLLSLGFDQSRIFTESTSTTTLENFQNAKEIIIAQGGTVFDDVVVVTSNFHLYRAIKLAKACGFTAVTGIGSTGLAVLLPHYYLREYAALIKEAYMGHFG